MKLAIVALISIFAFLQYKLWFQSNGLGTTIQLHKQILQQTSENKLLTARNSALTAEVEDLKLGRSALEERARDDLGMAKQDEVFYQVVKK